MLIRRLVLAGVIAATCVVSACHKRAHAPAPADAQAVAQAQSVTAQPAWLRTHMPDNVVAYVRLPSPWTLVGATPTGGALDVTAVNKRQLAVVAELRKAAARQPQLAHSDVGALIDVFLARLASPLEAVLVDPTGMPTPSAHVLVTAQLDVRNAADVQAMFAALAEPKLHLTGPLDSHGNGQLAMGARVHFDAASKRLLILAGVHPTSQADLDAVRTTLHGGAKAPPSMASLEPRIDASGQGLFAWVKLKGVAGLAASRLPAGMAGSLPADLAEHVDAIALGAGTVDGHGRLSLVLHAPGARVLGYLAPKLDFDGLQTVGTPRWAFTVALPAHGQVEKFDGQLRLELGPKGAAHWQQLAAKLQAMGVPDLTTLSGMLGPDMITFHDSQGTFTAVRLRDAKAFHAELDKLVAQNHWRAGIAKSGKASVHWLSAPGFATGTSGTPAHASSASGTDHAAIMTVVHRLRTHLYWTEEGRWLVFADVPQALADRAASDKSGRISDWLAHQHYAPSTWLGVTAVSDDAQRDAYYRYLRALVALGDLLDHRVDITQLPSAHSLGLPGKGQIGLSIGMTTDTFALHADYSQLPSELVQGHGGASAVAVAAILAAIAIPAYQDYVIRAQVVEGLALAQGAKTAVTEYRQAQGHYPRNNSAAGLPPADSIHGKYVVSVSVRDGVIQITYGAPPAQPINARIAGKTLLLTPQTSAHVLTWKCSSPDIAAKSLPQACRAP